MDHTLPSSERIRKRAEYTRIQGSGRKIASQSLLAFALFSDPGRGTPRLGITVSRRVGNAVVRNRVKRLLREAFRLMKQHFPAGWDVVLIARSSAATMSQGEAMAQVGEIARRLNVLASRPPGAG